MLFETRGSLTAGPVTRLNPSLASAKSLTWSLLLVIVTDSSVQIIIAMGWRAIVDPLYDDLREDVRRGETLHLSVFSDPVSMNPFWQWKCRMGRKLQVWIEQIPASGGCHLLLSCDMVSLMFGTTRNNA